MAKVVRVHHHGGPEVLVPEEMTISAPGSAEIRVAIAAIGLNRAEAGLRTGTYLFNPDPPFPLGFEGAGYITAVGPEVEGLAVGDYVSFIPAVTSFRYGTYADEALMPAAYAVKTPTAIDPKDAAAMWMAYLTAYGALVESGGLRPGETVLVTASSSSVGLAAIQIVRKFGGVPIAVTRTQAKRTALLDAGAAHVIALEDGPLAPAVMTLTAGAGADLILDFVVGEGIADLADSVAYNGRLVFAGALGGPAQLPMVQAFKKALTMHFFYLIELTSKPDWLARGKAFILAGVADGSLKVTIDRSFPLDSVADAHTYLETNQQFGKIVMETGVSPPAG